MTISKSDFSWKIEAAYSKEDDGDTATVDWGMKHNLRRKLLEKVVKDISACGLGIRSSRKDDLIKDKIWTWHHGLL